MERINYGEVNGKKVKIIVATHKQALMPSNEIYLPVYVGVSINNSELGYEKDNTGMNISELNPYFCELTYIGLGKI